MAVSSANKTGRPPATTLDEAVEQLGDRSTSTSTAAVLLGAPLVHRRRDRAGPDAPARGCPRRGHSVRSRRGSWNPDDRPPAVPRPARVHRQHLPLAHGRALRCAPSWTSGTAPKPRGSSSTGPARIRAILGHPIHPPPARSSVISGSMRRSSARRLSAAPRCPRRPGPLRDARVHPTGRRPGPRSGGADLHPAAARPVAAVADAGGLEPASDPALRLEALRDLARHHPEPPAGEQDVEDPYGLPLTSTGPRRGSPQRSASISVRHLLRARFGPPPTSEESRHERRPFWGPDFAALQEEDPEIADVILGELDRRAAGIQLIASENFTSPAVLAALGSTLSNKYAEGYPGRRYYGGCAVVDQAEDDRHRAGQGPVRRRARQPAAALGGERQPRRLRGVPVPGDTVLAMASRTAVTSPTARRSTSPASGSTPCPTA